MRIRLEIEDDGVISSTEVILDKREIGRARYRIDLQQYIGSIVRYMSRQVNIPIIIGSDTVVTITKTKGFTNAKKDIN